MDKQVLRCAQDDKLVRILKQGVWQTGVLNFVVIPANAGIHLGPVHMDSRVRGNDERASKPGFRMDSAPG